MRYIFLLTWILLAVICRSQGIIFVEDGWPEVLQKARGENKYIFVDVYTTWCGPCKRMSREIFTEEALGAMYNKNFINVKIDAEKGEGIGLAELWDVKAYPTLLFLDQEGHVISKERGFKTADYLVGAASSLFELQTLLSIVPEEYEISTLRKKLEHTKHLHAPEKLPYLRQFFRSLAAEEKIQDETIKLLINDVSILEGKILLHLVDYFTKQPSLFSDVFPIQKIDSRLKLLASEARQRLSKEEILYYHGLRSSMVEGQQFLAKNKNDIQKELDLDLLIYYDLQEGEKQNYAKQAIAMMNKYVMHFSTKEINRIDGYLNQELTPNNPRRNAKKTCHRIKEISYKFFQKFNDIKKLKQAKEWIIFAEKLITDAELLLIKACIHNRLGEHQLARSVISKAQDHHDYPERVSKFQRLIENYNLE